MRVRVPPRAPIKPAASGQHRGSRQYRTLKRQPTISDASEVPTPWKTKESVRLESLNPAPSQDGFTPPEPKRIEPPKLEAVPSPVAGVTIETVAS